MDDQDYYLENLETWLMEQFEIKKGCITKSKEYPLVAECISGAKGYIANCRREEGLKRKARA